MTQTGLILGVIFIAWIVFITIRGDLEKWLDVIGL